MILREIKYNLHYGDVRGDVLRSLHSISEDTQKVANRVCYFWADLFLNDSFYRIFCDLGNSHLVLV